MREKKKLVRGVGINDSDYKVTKFETVECENGQRKRKLIWKCPYYQVWQSILDRCYSTELHGRRPSYKGCSVHEDWLTFSKFKTWMEAQDWKDKHLDKDLLFEDNKVYSPDTCVFVSGMVNTFIIDRGAARGDYLIGVFLHKQAGKFQASCSNPFTKKIEYLGYFTTEIEAYEKWKKRKLELAHELAAIQTDPRVANALIKRYS